MSELFEQLSDQDFETMDAATAAKVIRLAARFREEHGLDPNTNAVNALRSELREGRTKGSDTENLYLVQRFVDGSDLSDFDRARLHDVVTTWGRTWASRRIEQWHTWDRAAGHAIEGNPIVEILRRLLDDNSRMTFLARCALLLDAAKADRGEAIRLRDQAIEGKARRLAALEKEMQDPIFAATLEAAVALESQNEWDAMLPYLRRAVHARLLSSGDPDAADVGNCCWLLEAFGALRPELQFVRPSGGNRFHNSHFAGNIYQPRITLTTDNRRESA